MSDNTDNESTTSSKTFMNHNQVIDVTKCGKCRCSILISEIIYENNNIYLKIVCPCREVENLLLDNFEKEYFYKEKIENNPKKILTNFLYCSCEEKTINKFEYYCKDSKKDLCKDCIGKEKDHSNHTIVKLKDNINIIGDIKKVYEEINKIDEKEEEENEENEEIEDDEDKKIKQKNKKIGEESNLIKKYNSLKDNDINNAVENFKSVIKLLKKLVEQYEDFPYYNLHQSINNLYEFCLIFKEEKNDNPERETIIKKIIRYKREFSNLKIEDKIKSIFIFQNNFDKLDILSKKKINFDFLEILHISENNVENIEPLTKVNFPKLIDLDLTKNRLNNKCIAHLQNLMNKDSIKILNLYDNNITEPKFFDIIKDFKNLTTLFIGHNKFKGEFNSEKYIFPDSLKIIGLTIGVFSATTIQYISKFHFIGLNTLYLKGNDIDSLDFIEELQCESVKDIWLRNNAISNLDIKINNKLKDSLIKLNLRGNQISDITKLKEFVNQFTKLEELVISDNKIDLNNNENLVILDQIIDERQKKGNFLLQYR